MTEIFFFIAAATGGKSDLATARVGRRGQERFGGAGGVVVTNETIAFFYEWHTSKTEDKKCPRKDSNAAGSRRSNSAKIDSM